MTTDAAIRIKDALLRTSIRLDATGVGLMGLGIAAFVGPFARHTGFTPAWSYGLAAAFLFYGVVGNWLANRPGIRPIGIGLSLFNFVGAAGQIALVLTGVLALTGAGKATLVFGGLWALVFGVLQLLGVRRLA
jgi:hypothetical protein